MFSHYVYIFAKSFLISHVCAGQRESALFSFCGLLNTNRMLHKIDSTREKATNFNFNNIR